ncbi:MAG: tetratricopeptide repeat protein [Myxococcota bacterium]
MTPKKADADADRCVVAGVACLDAGDLEGAERYAAAALEAATAPLAGLEGWSDWPTTRIMGELRGVDAVSAFARALWLNATVDELRGREDQARGRCLRAMELYARRRGPSEAIDLRAARELGSASARLGATKFAAAHARR